MGFLSSIVSILGLQSHSPHNSQKLATIQKLQNGPPSPYHIYGNESYQVMMSDFRVMMGYAYTINCDLSRSFPPNATELENIHPSVLVKAIYNKDSTNGALVAYNDFFKVIVVSFRSTVTKKLWFQNLEMFKTHWPLEPIYHIPSSSNEPGVNTSTGRLVKWNSSSHHVKTESSNIPKRPNYIVPEGVSIHYGFSKGYRSIRLEIMLLVARLARKHPDYRITFTGHSLGASLAEIAAVDYSIYMAPQQDLDRIWAFSYAAPRNGNRKYSNFVNSLPFAQNGQLIRINRYRDPTPLLPGKILGYEHSWRQYTMWDDLSVTPCDDPGNGECPSSAVFWTGNINLHRAKKYLEFFEMTISCHEIS